jgi:GTP cyclohydrolase FolE2
MEGITHVPTRCSTLQNVDAHDIQVVVHKNKKTGINVGRAYVDKLKDKKVQTKDLDMKKVRYEVFKFGMSGFKPEKKEEVKVALAIKLGAKPPKNKGYNYKELKLMKEKQLKEQLEQQKLLAVGKTKTGRPVAKGKKKFVNRKGKQSGILDPYGKAGKVNYTIPFYVSFVISGI